MDREILYLKKLFSDLSFFKADLDYKEEMLENYQIKFDIKVMEFLEKNPLIKEEYDKIFNSKIDSLYKDIEEDNEEEIKRINEKNQDKHDEVDAALAEEYSKSNLEKKEFKEDPDVKRIYRAIVKVTHPDKIRNASLEKRNILKKYYLEATESYKDQDLYGIVRISSLLDLDIGELSDKNLNRLEDKLKYMTLNIKTIEENMVWKCFEEVRHEFQRNSIIRQFVLTIINQHKKI